MPKFPEPPSVGALATVEPTMVTLEAGTWLWRLYRRGGPYPTVWDELRSFGPTDSRFDHHLPPARVQSRRILYCARAGATAIGELFQRQRVIDRELFAPWLVGFQLAHPVELLDLRSTWPTRAGASMAINSGSRPRARRWSQAIYDAYPTVQGLLYPSSMHANHDAIALYERAETALPQAPRFHRPINDPDFHHILVSIAVDLGYGLV